MARFPWVALVAVLAAFGSEASGVPTPANGALRLQVSQSQESAPIQGASITVVDPQANVLRRQAETDSTGRAEILDLAPREYYLRVEKETFESYQGTFTARPGEMTQRRVVLVRFGSPAPDDPPDAPTP